MDGIKKFFVCRAVNRADGSTSAPVESFEAEKDARATFFTRASQACSGDNVTDCVVLFTSDGFLLDHVGFTNKIQPEPNQE